jgi:hypothetical protein
MRSELVLPEDGENADVKQMTDGEWRVYMHLTMQQLMKQLSNHLRHHWIITVICASAAMGGVFSFVVGLMLFLIQRGMGG